MLAPNISQNEKVVLFDGVCKLCSAWARFLIRFDKKRVFRLATVQSPEGTEILNFYGFSTDVFETMVLVDGEKMYVQSTAFLNVMRCLPFPWPMFLVLLLIPKKIRDWMYDRIALNRYALFGKYDSCLVPTPDHESRFINGKRPI